MLHIRRRAVWLSMIAGASLAVAGTVRPAQPAPSLEEARELRRVIEAQLTAFLADDAERAFSYASPSIREMFVTADYFMAMVRGKYPVVYRHRSVGFFVPEPMGSEVAQRVRLTDQAGAPWLAVYSMQRQSDRSWRINGCVVTRDSGRSA